MSKTIVLDEQDDPTPPPKINRTEENQIYSCWSDLHILLALVPHQRWFNAEGPAGQANLLLLSSPGCTLALCGRGNALRLPVDVCELSLASLWGLHKDIWAHFFRKEHSSYDISVGHNSVRLTFFRSVNTFWFLDFRSFVCSAFRSRGNHLVFSQWIPTWASFYSSTRSCTRIKTWVSWVVARIINLPIFSFIGQVP